MARTSVVRYSVRYYVQIIKTGPFSTEKEQELLTVQIIMNFPFVLLLVHGSERKPHYITFFRDPKLRSVTNAIYYS